MPHSQQKHTYKNNTHKIRSNLKTKYDDNKRQRSVFGMYTEVGITHIFDSLLRFETRAPQISHFLPPKKLGEGRMEEMTIYSNHLSSHCVFSISNTLLRFVTIDHCARKSRPNFGLFWLPAGKKLTGVGGWTHPGKKVAPLETHEKKAGGRLLIPCGQMTADSIGLYLRRSQCSLQM